MARAKGTSEGPLDTVYDIHAGGKSYPVGELPLGLWYQGVVWDASTGGGVTYVIGGGEGPRWDQPGR